MKFKLAAAAVIVVATITSAPAVAQSSDTRLSYQAHRGERHTAIDRSGNGNNGRMMGGVTRRHGRYKFHPLSQGKHEYDRIVARRDPSLSPHRHLFSYGVRLKVSPDAPWRHREMAVIRHGDWDLPGGDYKLELRKRADGLVAATCVIHGTGPGHGWIRGRGQLTTVADGHWHTILCSRPTSESISLSIDGVTATRQANGGDIGSVRAPVSLMIGCQLRGSGPRKREQFVGKMDHIRITVGG